MENAYLGFLVWADYSLLKRSATLCPSLFVFEPLFTFVGHRTSQADAKQASKQAGKKASKQASKQAGRQAGKQASKQAGRWAASMGRFLEPAHFRGKTAS